MSKKDAAFLVSRAFALLLITWALVDVTYMPERLFSLFHYIGQASVLNPRDFWSSRYWLLSMFAVVRIVGLFIASWLFWTAGARVEALFLRDGSSLEKTSLDER